MALTPEDVVNKRFQPTKFREGYDQDEVDDFLDEVVVELRRLNQENEELKQRLVAADSRIAELQRSGGQGGAAPVAAAAQADNGEAERLQRENEELKQRLAQAQQEAAAAKQQAEQQSQQAQAAPAAAYQAPADDANDPNATNNLLQLARRLHEEHVREGVEKRDQLIAEGHATAARIVAEAESKQRAQISALDQERTGLERRIDELRTFERDYRKGLKSYIEGQLRDLDAPVQGGSGGSRSAAPVSAGNGVPAPVPAGGSDESSNQGQQPPVFPGFGG
ncbi:DivIVA domain-containing protein [Leifsonia sp. fls2-241-R2A-40a]|uniref:DivIVA domain-containing protein n=1 Tax=Leifsonia sp. fls2-241-R2A-40a TaxID=3040290 RepID=UPI002551230B|nr:DivIVA domain-containing protein [Leifsonia sp. fls2-241-R2A-40a]